MEGKMFLETIRHVAIMFLIIIYLEIFMLIN